MRGKIYVVKIVYIANARMPTEKAHGFQIARMCAAMSSLGHQVMMLVPFRFNPLGRKPVDLFQYYGIPPIFSVRQLWTPDLLPLGWRISSTIYVWQSLLFGFLGTLYARWEFADAALWYTRDLRVAWLFSHLSKTPFFYEANDLFPSTKRGQQAVRDIASSPLCLGVVVVNRILKRRYISEIGITPEKLIVVPNGVDLNPFEELPPRNEVRKQLNLPLRRPIVGYVGRFRTMGREKGIPELIRAMARVPPINGQDPLLLCVGGPMDVVPSYRQLAQYVGVPERRLRFVDRVPNRQVPLWLRAFDIAAMPFPDTEHYAFFMSPLKLFEYMAAGVPIIASDLPSLREVLTDGLNAHFVPPDDPDALSRGIEEVLSNPAYACRLANRARHDVAAFTWERRAEKITAFAQGLEKRRR